MISKLLVVFFVSFVGFLLSSFSFKQGFQTNGDLVIYQTHTHDALWHLALSESLKTSIPPENPIYSGEVLKGYHYFTDLLFNFISFTTNISTPDVYLKVSPFVLAILLTLTTFRLFDLIFKDKLLASFGTTLSLLGSGFAYLINRHQSVFWLDQPINWFTNQQLVLSIIMINVILILLHISVKKWWWMIGLLTGLMTGVKVYGILILLPGLGLISLFKLWKEQDISYLKLTVLAGVVVLGIILIVGSNSNFPFIFEPGFFIKTMYEGQNRLNNDVWELRRQTFLADYNYFRVGLLWLEGLAVFLVGNYGLKILGLVGIGFLIKRSILNFILSSIIILSLIFPLLFIQKGVVWNTIQFMHFAQIPLTILLILTLQKCLKQLISMIVLVFIILVSLPTTYQVMIRSFDQNNYDRFPSAFISHLQSVKELPADSVILVASGLNQTAVVPALTGREVYFSDSIINDILLINYTHRESKIKQLEISKQGCMDKEYLITQEDLYHCQDGKLISTKKVVSPNSN